MDITHAILGFTILNSVLVLWSIRMIVQEMKISLAQLDGALAEAIKGILTGENAVPFEAPNPIQQAIAQMLTQRMQQGPIDLPRRDDGTFAP
jgi:hypothetical protein